MHIVGDEVLKVLTTTTEQNNRRTTTTEQQLQHRTTTRSPKFVQGQQAEPQAEHRTGRNTGRNFQQLLNNLRFQGQEVIRSLIGGQN